MATETKPLTAAKVRAVLKKAGHRKSEKHKTRVPGWNHRTAGYAVRILGDEIEVEHYGGDYTRDPEEAARVAEYRESLRTAGIAAEIVRKAIGPVVVCRGWL